MIQYVLIQCQQIEAIRHATKTTKSTITIEEWELGEKLAQSTICMHLDENIYFSIVKGENCNELQEKLKYLHEEKLILSKPITIR